MLANIIELVKCPVCFAVFFGCFAATFLLTPLVIRLAHRIGGVDDSGFHRKIHSQATPVMGGLAILLPFLVVVAVEHFGFMGRYQAPASQRMDLSVLMAGAMGMALLGFVDDVRGLRARHKLLGQVLIAAFVALSGNAVSAVGIPFIGTIPFDTFPGLSIFMAVLWIVGVTNAFNLIDGMDGLASGVAFFAALALGAISAINGSPAMMLVCLALSGSLLAFLRYNWHPAKIFLGDTGSMFIGFTLASVSLMGAYKAHGAVLMLGAVMALGIPIFEVFISMLRRHLGGFPIFSADSRHTHHRLMRLGFTQRQVACILYIAALFCLVAGVMNVALPMRSPESFVPIAVFLVTIGGIMVIAGYSKSIESQFRRRPETRRRLAFASYASMILNSEAEPQTVRTIFDLMCEELDLGFVEVRFENGAKKIQHCSRGKSPLHITPHPAMDRFSVKNADGTITEVLYQHCGPVSEYDQQIVSMCLASIFERYNAGMVREVLELNERERLAWEGGRAS